MMIDLENGLVNVTTEGDVDWILKTKGRLHRAINRAIKNPPDPKLNETTKKWFMNRMLRILKHAEKLGWIKC